ncbi:hypothetical protein NDU88_004386 [Pleurodeles waltl]|uniref:Uncharacterized protein n=1 Tax=Pleurodeles waltl TaxID=8319 RepID=A0AAV7SIM6_PLEWA|nr:hypothetical protein NDU88_004386 [Pleurodeles waltl]
MVPTGIRCPPKLSFYSPGGDLQDQFSRGLRSRGPTNFVLGLLTRLPALRFPSPRGLGGPEANASLHSAVGSAESGPHQRLGCSAGSVAPGRRPRPRLRRLGTHRGPSTVRGPDSTPAQLYAGASLECKMVVAIVPLSGSASLRFSAHKKNGS